MARKGENFRFAPSRWKGILFLLPLCTGLIWLETFLSGYFNVTQVGLQFFLLMIAELLIAVPLILLLYRLYCLLFSEYRLERDGLHIKWGFRTDVIPLNAIEWIRYPQEMTDDVPWSVLPMPGAYVGTVTVDDRLTYEFLASDMKTMLFVGTARAIYCISPRKPDAFLTGFERILQMGALDNVEWVTTRPGAWMIEAWRDKIGRYCTMLSIIILIGLYIFVGSRFQTDKIISLSFSPSGEPMEEIASTNMLIVPLAATVIFLTGSATALLLFQNRENRRLAELTWGAVTAAVLQCLAAAIMIF